MRPAPCSRRASRFGAVLPGLALAALASGCPSGVVPIRPDTGSLDVSMGETPAADSMDASLIDGTQGGDLAETSATDPDAGLETARDEDFGGLDAVDDLGAADSDAATDATPADDIGEVATPGRDCGFAARDPGNPDLRGSRCDTLTEWYCRDEFRRIWGRTNEVVVHATLNFDWDNCLCLRGTTCNGQHDPAGCTCGDGPVCPIGQLCVSLSPDAAARCECIPP